MIRELSWSFLSTEWKRSESRRAGDGGRAEGGGAREPPPMAGCGLRGLGRVEERVQARGTEDAGGHVSEERRALRARHGVVESLAAGPSSHRQARSAARVRVEPRQTFR